MISTDSMNEYTENQELNREILVWINNRILSLLVMYKDIGNDTEWNLDYLTICFPRTFIEDNGIDKCLQVLDDIRDILESSYVRDNLSILHKYVLINLIEYYQDIYEDAKECNEQDVCNVFFPPMEESLVRKIYKAFGYEFDNKRADDIAEEENHPRILIDRCLEDIDGLFWDDVFDEIEVDIDLIDHFVDDCLSKIEQGEFVKWDLEYYVDLMSRGTKERYYKIKPLLSKIQEKMTEAVAVKVFNDNMQLGLKKSLNKDTLLQDIFTACMSLQGSEGIIKQNENARNTYIREILRSKGYDIVDQTLRGESASRKQLGELDFEIMKTSQIPFAIYEALNLMNFSKSGQNYLIEHLYKLLDNYNPIGVPLVFLVCYAKCKKEDFDSYWLRYCDYIKNYSYTSFSAHFICEHKLTEGYVRCSEYMYECGNVFTTVYYIVVRMSE